ncbi:hypothetical protein [Cupriavidus sp. DL-D2]|uniref:hypothetical protein n=1 Tax=Cupriavidus sp. DL-D2 TaxID=3144974 RepID=UPI0032120B0F
MATTITETPELDYTWETADFTWNSQQAGLRTWENAHVARWGFDSTEMVVISDQLAKATDKLTRENFALLEAIRKSTDLSPQELLGIRGCYVDNVAFQLRVVETVSMLEKAGRGISIPFTESFSLSESEQKTIGLSASEALNLLEVFSRAVDWRLAPGEQVGITVVEGRHPQLGRNESLAISEKSNREIGLGKNELLAFAEVFGRTVVFKRAIAEGLTAADSLSKAYEMEQAEAVRLVEALMRNPNAVVSDMLVSNQDVTFQDFLRIVNTGRIPGYGDFRTFVQGDYEYSEAMFRVLLDATSSDRGSISDLKVSVDVPDVFDRGMAFIEDAENGLYVQFSRPFHITPEMSMLLKGGTTLAFPKLITLDQYGFTVKLFDKNDVAVTGSVSWSAHGY